MLHMCVLVLHNQLLLFHRVTRTAYIYYGCLAWYNVVLTSRVHSGVKCTVAVLCDGGISVLNHCLLWSKFINAHLHHSRQQFNIHIIHILCNNTHKNRLCSAVIQICTAVLNLIPWLYCIRNCYLWTILHSLLTLCGLLAHYVTLSPNCIFCLFYCDIVCKVKQ